MANKPGYSEARKARGTATMTIEPMDKPKTFTDKNLELGYGVGGANNVKTDNAKPGDSIKAEPNVAKPHPADNLIKS